MLAFAFILCILSLTNMSDCVYDKKVNSFILGMCEYYYTNSMIAKSQLCSIYLNYEPCVSVNYITDHCCMYISLISYPRRLCFYVVEPEDTFF